MVWLISSRRPAGAWGGVARDRAVGQLGRGRTSPTGEPTATLRGAVVRDRTAGQYGPAVVGRHPAAGAVAVIARERAIGQRDRAVIVQTTAAGGAVVARDPAISQRHCGGSTAI